MPLATAQIGGSRFNTVTGVAGNLSNVGDMDGQIETFFTRYAQALLDRDAEAVADLYAVPCLIAFPGQCFAVTSREQTRDFFAGSWDGYDGVTEAEPRIEVIAQTGHSVWADVTWSYGGKPRERFVYQLLDSGSGWQVGVLTPLEVGSTATS